MTTRKKFLFLPLSAVALLLALASLAFACTDVQGQTVITEIIHTAGAASSCPPKDSANPSNTSWKCAAPGDTLKATATGAAVNVAGYNDRPIAYYLYFLPNNWMSDDMDACMAGRGEAGSPTGVPTAISQPAYADSNGNISETTGRIPATGPTGAPMPLGPARVCFMGGGWDQDASTVRQQIDGAYGRVLNQNATAFDSLSIVMI